MNAYDLNSILDRTISGTYVNNSLGEIGNYAFAYCSKLTSIILPSVTILGSYAFYYSGLISADFSSLTSINHGAFGYNSKLVKIVIRNTNKVCGYGTTSSTYDPKNASLKIYVPRDLLESYKIATNWSRLTDKFVALEDYTVDGTTTDELITQ